MNTIYLTQVTASGGRNGVVKSQDEVLNLEVRIPKEMGGPGGNYTNPEQLFAAGYSACFDSALQLVAGQQKIRLQNSKVKANVGLQFSESTGFTICASLEVQIPGVEKQIALDLLQKAHEVCPYSKALKNNVDVSVSLVE